jgi:hypothetical protein
LKGRGEEWIEGIMLVERVCQLWPQRMRVGAEKGYGEKGKEILQVLRRAA